MPRLGFTRAYSATFCLHFCLLHRRRAAALLPPRTLPRLLCACCVAPHLTAISACTEHYTPAENNAVCSAA